MNPSKPLREGDLAPAFHLPDDEGKEITLADFSGRNIVLYFFPKSLTPG